jgi:hypothetical protein
MGGKAQFLPNAAVGKCAITVFVEKVDKSIEHHALGYALLAFLG